MTFTKLLRVASPVLLALGTVLIIVPELAARTPGAIFPEPREITRSGSDFVIDNRVTIAVPAVPSEQDIFLATTLADELGDRFGVHLNTERVARLDTQHRMIVVGSIANPLVAACCTGRAIKVDSREPGPEGYILRTDANLLLVAGSDDRGAFLWAAIAAATAGERPQRTLAPGPANPRLARKAIPRTEVVSAGPKQHSLL